MPERVMGFFQPIRDKWGTLEKVQKIQIASGVLVVLIALALTVFFMTRTAWRVAWANLAHVDAMQISTVLDENEIRNRVSPDGLSYVVEVDQSRLNDARFLVETMGIGADRDFTFEDALDFSGIGATETLTQQNLLRARQTDLEQTLTGMNGVIWARVELALPDANRFFVQTQDPARATVTLGTTRRLGRAEGETIARFISRSVLGLDMENIEVLDTDFNVLFSGLDFGEEDSMLTEMMDLMQRERVQVTNQVRDLFNHLGFDAISVAPNLVYDQIRTTAERTTWDAPLDDMEAGIPLTERTLRASAQGTQAGWEPGFGAWQQQAIPTYPFAVGGDMRASQDEAERTFAVNELRELIQDVPSSYLRDISSISINVARFQVYRQESMMRQNGGDFSQDEWYDFMMTTNQAISDDDDLVAHMAQLINTATGIPLERVTVTVWEVPHFIPYYPTPPAVSQIIMYAILALLLGLLAFGLIRRTQPDEDDEIEPELSVEDLLVSTQMEEALEEEMLEPIGFEDGSEAKQKIDAFIEDKPEAAASLLRHWLNETEI